MSISKLLFTAIVFSALGLSGCSNMSHQDKTTAGGAVVGGVAGNLLCGGVLCTGVAYILYFRLIETAGPAKALSVTFVVPVFAVAYGVLLLGETVTLWMLGCGLVILLGTALSTGVLGQPRR